MIQLTFHNKWCSFGWVWFAGSGWGWGGWLPLFELTAITLAQKIHYKARRKGVKEEIRFSSPIMFEAWSIISCLIINRYRSRGIEPGGSTGDQDTGLGAEVGCWETRGCCNARISLSLFPAFFCMEFQPTNYFTRIKLATSIYSFRDLSSR